MKNSLLWSALALAFAISFPVSAQNSESVAYYMNDDGISSSKLILKTDVVSIIHGEAPFLLEYVLNQRLSAEGGLGILLPYYVHDFVPLLVDSKPNFSNNSLGTSLWLKFKLYHTKAPELHYIDVTVHHRNYSSLDATDFSFNLGNQLMVGQRMTFDYSVGVGVRTQHLKSSEYLFDTDTPFTLIIPLQLKLGYLL
jgi:hypothetical protein